MFARATSDNKRTNASNRIHFFQQTWGKWHRCNWMTSILLSRKYCTCLYPLSSYIIGNHFLDLDTILVGNHRPENKCDIDGSNFTSSGDRQRELGITIRWWIHDTTFYKWCECCWTQWNLQLQMVQDCKLVKFARSTIWQQCRGCCNRRWHQNIHPTIILCITLWAYTIAGNRRLHFDCSQAICAG